MGSVYRPKGRNNYRIKYRGTDGRWVSEATGSDDKPAAIKLLRIREGDIASAAPMVRQIHVDFPLDVIRLIDAKVERLGISRQSWIKRLVATALGGR